MSQRGTQRRPGVSGTALLIAVMAGLATLTPPRAGAEPPCWQSVLADWSDGAITGTYEIGCYRQALRHLPEDVRLYSSAAEDIERALAQRFHPARGVASVRPLSPQAASAGRGGGFASAPLALAGALALAGLGAAAVALRWRGRRRGS